MYIASVGTAFPGHRYTQSEIAETLVERWRDKMPEPRVLTRLHANCGVDTRYLVLPIEEYAHLGGGFKQTNDLWIQAAVALGQQAVERALTPLGLTAADISAIFFASVTGIASPTIDARLVNLMPFPTHVKRTPIFGLGCVAGAAGIARASDYLRAFPDQCVLLLSVELCSLTWQDDDQSIANLISTGLFGDGCAAVVLAGDHVKLPRPPASAPNILATRSTFYRHTEHIMGWDIRDTGFRIVLSPDVPKVVLENVRRDVESFLAEHSLTLADIGSWIFHSGGPKVLEATEKALDLPENALALSWKSLREVGNLSAASVLCVLADTLQNQPGKPGTYSILAAMGPAFCLELVLLQWWTNPATIQAQLSAQQSGTYTPIMQDIANPIIDLIARSKSIPPASITPATTFDELNIDSLDKINLSFEVEELFSIQIPDASINSLRTVGDVIEGVRSLRAKQHA